MHYRRVDLVFIQTPAVTRLVERAHCAYRSIIPPHANHMYLDSPRLKGLHLFHSYCSYHEASDSSTVHWIPISIIYYGPTSHQHPTCAFWNYLLIIHQYSVFTSLAPLGEIHCHYFGYFQIYEILLRSYQEDTSWHLLRCLNSFRSSYSC